MSPRDRQFQVLLKCGENVADLPGIGLEETLELRIGSALPVTNGDGTSTAGGQVTPGGARYFGVQLADMNGDDVLDLISNNSNSAGNQLGNGDSDLDIVTSASSGGTGVFVLSQNASKSFVSSGVAGSTNSRGRAVGDVNGDGRVDIFANREGGSSVDVFTNSGGGAFTAGASISTGPNPYFIDAVDLNGDGNLDLVTPNASGGSISVVLGNGDGTFGTATPTSQGATPRNTAIGDINGDGALDIVSANQGSSSIGLFFGNPVVSGDVRGLLPNSIDLRSISSARDAFGALAENQAKVVAELGNLGVLAARIETTISNLQLRKENMIAAKNRIEDVDIAGESAAVISNTILQEQASAVAAEANLSTGVALALIEGV